MAGTIKTIRVSSIHGSPEEAEQFLVSLGSVLGDNLGAKFPGFPADVAFDTDVVSGGVDVKALQFPIFLKPDGTLAFSTPGGGGGETGGGPPLVELADFQGGSGSIVLTPPEGFEIPESAVCWLLAGNGESLQLTTYSNDSSTMTFQGITFEWEGRIVVCLVVSGGEISLVVPGTLTVDAPEEIIT